MIKRNNKKGFTIVELVIVIAVIAILAAVLIPTFAGIIKKAQLSSDQQAVRNMNVALAASGDLEDDMNKVIDALSENGFNSKKALIPVSKDYEFMYSKANDCIVLVNAEDAANKVVVYPEDITYDANDCVSLEASVKYLDVAANDVAALEEALVTGNENIKLEADIKLETEITLPAGSNVTLDLNGHKLTTDKPDGSRSKYLVAGKNSTLTIVNGEISARGIQVNNGGKLVIGKDANVVVNAVDDNGGACIWINEGGEVVIDGGTFTATGGDKATTAEDIGPEPGVINNSGTLTINDGTFTALNTGCYAINNYGTLVINGGTFKAWRGVLSSTAGTLTVNGGDFTVTDTSAGGHVIYAAGAGVVVNVTGGTFSSEDFSIGEGVTFSDTRTK